jgi:hypothetical protein
MTEHMTFSQHTSVTLFKDAVELSLEVVKDQQDGVRKLMPVNNNKLIFYIEDLHMCQIDQYGDKPALEAIRDYLTYKEWLSIKKKTLR